MEVTIKQQFTALPHTNEIMCLLGVGPGAVEYTKSPVYPGQVSAGGTHFWHITNGNKAMYRRQIAPGLVRIVLVEIHQ